MVASLTKQFHRGCPPGPGLFSRAPCGGVSERCSIGLEWPCQCHGLEPRQLREIGQVAVGLVRRWLNCNVSRTGHSQSMLGRGDVSMSRPPGRRRSKHSCTQGTCSMSQTPQSHGTNAGPFPVVPSYGCRRRCPRLSSHRGPFPHSRDSRGISANGQPSRRRSRFQDSGFLGQVREENTRFALSRHGAEQRHILSVVG
jgi:hypothetical protein